MIDDNFITAGAVLSLALVEAILTFKIGAPRLIDFEVSLVVNVFYTESIPPLDARVFLASSMT
jgi:hypothetical protein